MTRRLLAWFESTRQRDSYVFPCSTRRIGFLLDPTSAGQTASEPDLQDKIRRHKPVTFLTSSNQCLAGDGRPRSRENDENTQDVLQISFIQLD
jgi:hypothetical protein